VSLKSLIFIALFIVLYPACTNLKIGQTQQRFWDNMNLPLKTYSDFAPSDPNNFSFSMMGDTHVGSDQGNLMVKALQMSKTDGDSFAVIAGDDSNTGLESELLTFESNIASVGLPVYPAIGNHDIFFNGWDHYKAIVGRSMYSFNAGVVHFVILDTANGTFGEEELNWLKSDLAATNKPVKVAVMHFPAVFGEFSTIYRLSDDEEITIFENIMNKYGVQLVVSGHYHGYSDKNVGGTRYIVTGACNDLLDIGNTSQYIKVMITNGNTVTTRQVPL
jgi:predicted phosphodiesterase